MEADLNTDGDNGMTFTQLTTGELIFSLVGLGLGVVLTALTVYVRCAYNRRNIDWAPTWFVMSLILGHVMLAVVSFGFLMGFAGGVLSSGDMTMGAVMGLGGMACYLINTVAAGSGLGAAPPLQVELAERKHGLMALILR